MIVACASEVVRLNASGSVVQTYLASTYGDSYLFAANLDPDGKSFWTADYNSGDVEKIDISSGNRVLHFTASAGAHGLIVYGAPVGGAQTTPETLANSKLSENNNQTSCGHPVDCATGDFYHSFADLSIPGRGVPIALSRTYNSLATNTVSPFGFGWSSTYSMALTTDTATADVTVHQEDGSSVVFAPTGGGNYTAAPRVLATLVQNPDGTYSFTRRRRETFTFSSTGRLARQTDLNGYNTTLAYSPSGQLSTVTDPPAGRSPSPTTPAARSPASATRPAAACPTAMTAPET